MAAPGWPWSSVGQGSPSVPDVRPDVKRRQVGGQRSRRAGPAAASSAAAPLRPVFHRLQRRVEITANRRSWVPPQLARAPLAARLRPRSRAHPCDQDARRWTPGCSSCRMTGQGRAATSARRQNCEIARARGREGIRPSRAGPQPEPPMHEHDTVPRTLHSEAKLSVLPFLSLSLSLFSDH